jgi:hypothetical protein
MRSIGANESWTTGTLSDLPDRDINPVPLGGFPAAVMMLGLEKVEAAYRTSLRYRGSENQTRS